MDKEKVKMMFKLMEYDVLSEAQHDLVISFEKQFQSWGGLSGRQCEILEDIFKKAAGRA